MAAVQRAPRQSPLDDHTCGPDDPPTTLDEAKRRRNRGQEDPWAISHEDFERFVRGHVADKVQERNLIEWSLDIKYGRMDRLADIRDRQKVLERGPYGSGRERIRGDKPLPRRRPGAWTADVVGGVVDYGVGIGKGARHAAKYGVFTIAALLGHPGPLKRLAADDASFFQLIGRVISEPRQTFTKVATGFTAMMAAEKYLTRKQIEDVKKAAGKSLPDQVEKLVGKAIGKKIALTVLAQPLLNKLSEKIPHELMAKLVKKGGGGALLLLSILGFMEDAHTASRRLKDKYPSLYADLEPDDLHMAWFLVEPHEKELRNIALQQM